MLFPDLRQLRFAFLILLSVGLSVPLHAQQEEGGDIALAREYVRKGENEKAVFLFGRLRVDEQMAPNVLPDYVSALQALKRHKDAEKLMKKAVRQQPKEVSYSVLLGGIYTASGDEAAANKQYEKVISQLTSEQVVPVATEFMKRKLSEWAEKTYLRGRQLAGNETEFAPSSFSCTPRAGKMPP
ncbi:tetratricopeptide repeat protein [Hymenobacter sp. HDW8]|uniref:tetratricopeptide repeat protein n=1 Tax=Hymenobacter sp. HDW8 TaxID=2714932 RepID=UPI001F0E3116|nr:hypothetical protein [Hymenobacter sp. HDW8]